MSTQFAIARCLGFFALLALAQPVFAQVDQVYPVKGAVNRGNITTITRDQVTLDVSGVTRSFNVNEIMRITFADEPSALNNTRNAIAAKNYPIALEELEKLEGQTFSKDFIRADAQYYRALCMARMAMSEGGDKAAAMTAILNWVKANPNSHHFYEAAETLGNLAAASGSWADAARYYGPIANAPWPDYQMRANNAVGRALIGQKQFPEALQRFDAVLAVEGNSPEVQVQKQLATVGKAICLGETGKPDEGIAMLQEIIKNNDSEPEENKLLFARTYNALGSIYVKNGKPKDALQAFLHTDIMFFQDPETHAEALYHLSKLWNDVNKSAYAAQAREQLTQSYGGSYWASLQ